MTVLGAHIPVSVWTLVALAAGTVVSVLVWRPATRRTGWRPGATLVTLLLFTVALSLTVTPDGDQPKLGLAACIPYDWNDLLFTVLHTGGGLVGNVLNLLLLLPLTASLVLATGRTRSAVVLALLMPPMVELVQTQLPGRSCVVSDLLTNMTGALLGVAVGWAAERRLRQTRS